MTGGARVPVKHIRLAAVSAVAFLGFPLAGFLAEGPGGVRAAVATAGTAVFGALFARAVWVGIRPAHSGRGTLPLVGMAVVGAAMLTVMGMGWLLTASYYLAATLLLDQPRRRWLPGLATLIIADVALGVWVVEADPGRVLWTVLQIGLFGLLTLGAYRIGDLSGQLRAAQAEAEGAAVARERLRIARDLHDILGQRLTEVILKTELAARLIKRDPDRAVSELTELSKVARGALEDVRATVSDYRRISLAGELAAARTLMRSVGVTLVTRVPEVSLPTPLDEIAACAVREGVTNVLRHSGALRCEISVESGEALVVAVSDDGPVRQAAPERAAGPGTGLAGLAERLDAVGGRLSAGRVGDRFVLRAEIPGEPG
ncbi:sensor histidine kinase [Rhizohabitans arisaemae]|uniref:sensor histidine kinase n=1 Tax=Rhizohabitans arisaemae TaxID=2720610 RepID=UPI0024B11784|nr:histidine kinase [Rhizohabitans arisaemae]